MSQTDEYADINPCITPGASNHDREYTPLSNVPPGYATMKTDAETALVDKIEEQYGSLSCCGYVKMALVLTVGSVGCLMMLVICIGIPPSMIVMGALYLHSCPAQPYIPIYLVVGGTCSLFSVIFAITIRIRFKNKSDHLTKGPDMALLAISNFIHCLTIAWFIAGCTWVYGIYKPTYDHHHVSAYCDKNVYLFSFWLLNSIFIAIGGLLLLGLFMLICSLVNVGQTRRWNG